LSFGEEGTIWIPLANGTFPSLPTHGEARAPPRRLLRCRRSRHMESPAARGALGDDASGASTSQAAPGAVDGGASPDSLRNTPSNIARLEDAIEHCAARRKYLARTKSPSDGEDVRWYFCKLPLADKALSASVPRTEIVGKGDYFRFSMRDSLAVEASFLEREEALLAYWWREYAECSEGPKGSLVAADASDSKSLYKVEEERVGVPVKGGLYEVCIFCLVVCSQLDSRRMSFVSYSPKQSYLYIFTFFLLFFSGHCTCYC
jgi:hypothetical protein